MPRIVALATDYDGTLARNDGVDDATVAALERLKASGRALILITGRVLPELLEVFPRVDLFHLVVAENGALLYRPDTREQTLLADPPPPAFLEALRLRGVHPISTGRVIVATWRPHETTIADVIAFQNLKLDVILNKRAIMVLPAGIHKGSGLSAALESLNLNPGEVVAVGDAENDVPLFLACGFSAAVANALPAVKEQARLVTQGERGAGVSELIGAILDERLIDRGRAILRIRPYRPDDLDALIGLFHQSIHTLAARDYTPDQIQAWAPLEIDRDRWRTRRSNRSTWVARIGNSIVGFTALESDGHLDMMFVHPDHARKGIATALLRHVERLAHDTGLNRLFTEASLTARGFFESQGFTVLERQQVALRGQSLVSFRMEKVLEPSTGQER